MSQLQDPRRQITLFVPEPERTRIDAVRERFNPVQHGQIAAHVTLCRDQEVRNWSELQQRANSVHDQAISLHFGLPVREGNLVFLPVTGPTDAFQTLREIILDDDNAREQTPHITLVHPRNGTCSESDFGGIQTEFCAEFTVEFSELTFIQQEEGCPWRSVRTLRFA